MDKELKAEWVAALRSGEYEQTRGFLHDENGYCCLGVLCEVAQFPEWDGEVCGGTANIIPKDICDRIGLPYSAPKGIPDDDVLIVMNDEDKTFSEIADYIEANL